MLLLSEFFACFLPVCLCHYFSLSFVNPLSFSIGLYVFYNCGLVFKLCETCKFYIIQNFTLFNCWKGVIFSSHQVFTQIPVRQPQGESKNTSKFVVNLRWASSWVCNILQIKKHSPNLTSYLFQNDVVLYLASHSE